MRFRRREGKVSRQFAGVAPTLTLTLALALLLLALAAGAGGGALAQAGGDIFTVRNVPVDETAGTAAEARALALDTGQRRAFRRLIERLVPEDQQGLVPQVDSNQLQYYVRDFSVANERTSAVRYLADLTFRFNGNEVRRLLRGNGVGFAETRGEPVVVLPVFQRGEGESVLWGDGNPWLNVWAQRPGDGGLVPLIVPLGDLSDISAIDAARAEAGDAEALRAIADLYGAQEALVASASLSGDPQAGSAVLEMTTRRYGGGRSGASQSSRVIQVEGEPLDGFLRRGADRIDNAVQEAWKRQNLLDYGNQRSIQVFVPLEGLNDWLNVRRRLHSVASIQRSDVSSLTRREATLEITFLGDEQRLTRALQRRDLYLALREDSSWELGLAEKRGFTAPSSQAPSGQAPGSQAPAFGGGGSVFTQPGEGPGEGAGEAPAGEQTAPAPQ